MGSRQSVATGKIVHGTNLHLQIVTQLALAVFVVVTQCLLEVVRSVHE